MSTSTSDFDFVMEAVDRECPKANALLAEMHAAIDIIGVEGEAWRHAVTTGTPFVLGDHVKTCTRCLAHHQAKKPVAPQRAAAAFPLVAVAQAVLHFLGWPT